MTGIKPPQNGNYAATVVQITRLVPLAGCDNVVGAPLAGYQAIVSKDTQVGDVGILFTAETQLSDEYARNNNLYRHPEKNADPDKKGYLEDNRRVKALKFRGHRSDALFMPLNSVEYTQANPFELTKWLVFDELNGHPICNKYVIKTRGERSGQAKVKKEDRVDERFFPKHFDTSNYFKNAHLLSDDDYIYVTQKLHGTSVRIGHVPVARKLTWIEKLARKFGAKIQETTHSYVYGSRNVVKDPNNPDGTPNFYSNDIYTETGKQLEGLLPKNFMVYGEIVGWASPDTPIQKGYTYRHAPDTRTLFVYRVTFLNPEGREVDLSWPQVKDFCDNLGITTVPEMWRGSHKDFDADHWMDAILADWTWTRDLAEPVDGSNVDEGVVIRRDGGMTPLVLKAKSPLFLQYETKMLDKDVVDMESDG